MIGCPSVQRKPERRLVRESRRLIPALRLGMVLLLVGRPHRLCHALQRQDAHLLFLRLLQNLRAEIRLREAAQNSAEKA